MTSKELYRITFQGVKPSQEAVQKLLEVQDVSRRGNKVSLKWIVILAMLVLGAAGCGHAIRTHFMAIQTHDYIYCANWEKYRQATLDSPTEELFQLELPQELGNGFIFLNCVVMDQSVSEWDGVAEDRKMLDVTYGISGELSNRANWGQPDIHLNVGQLFDYQQENMEQAICDAKTQIGEVKVYYLESKIYTVAPDYELTDEDLEMLENESIPIITGLKVGEKPQLKTITSCYWTMDNKFYELTEYNSRLTADEWFEIAKTIIEAQNSATGA